MDAIFKAIGDYLSQSTPPSNLVLQIEFPVNDQVMMAMGFRKENDLWVISKENAILALRDRAGIKPKFDYNQHWKAEYSRPIPGGSNE